LLGSGLEKLGLTMEYEKRVVCYFDILGFRGAVCNGLLNASDIDRMFGEIDSVIEEWGGDIVDGSYFSDSFVVSIKLMVGTIKQLNFIVKILEKLLDHGLLARGGIAYGEVIHEGARVYGPALIKAVKAEERAIYPRIIADESLREVILPTVGNARIDYLTFLTDYVFVKTDEVDGVPYIDYISSILKRNNARDARRFRSIIDGLTRVGLASTDQGIVRKYSWVRDKLAAMASG
jgi:hypothetical protein